MILHAGLIAQRVRERWRGVLILGASGSGKSDLMLRSLGLGFRLVADDRTVVWPSAGRLFGRAPDALAGLIEFRGVGVLRQPHLPLAEIGLVVHCLGRDAAAERLPEDAVEEIEGLSVPTVSLRALDASAPAKLACAVMRLGPRRGAA